MTSAAFAINFFVALFALIDPVGNVPLYAAATSGATPAARRLTAVYIALFAFAFMTFFFLTGIGLLRFFGVSLPAFRIAGGIVLLLMGLDMTRGDLTSTFAAAESELEPLTTRAYAAKRFEVLIVPFGMPLLIGPGAISSAINLCRRGACVRRERRRDRHRRDLRGVCAGDRHVFRLDADRPHSG